ncbi:MAG: rhodanese-like domain-containing protein [Deltaproteobacteria bacterium]
MTHKITWLFLCLLLLVSSNSMATGASVENISARTSAALIEKNQSNPDFIILDIRTPGEFSAGHIDGARMIDFYAKSFAQEFRSLDRNKTYLVYCRSGNRSGQLMQAVNKMDFKKVYNMKSGLVDWVGQGFKLIPSQPE